MSQPIAAAPFPLLPRSPVRRTLVVAAAYLALTLGFVITGFPVDRLMPQVEALASAATGSRVEIADLDIDVIALLPALHARDVAITTPGGRMLRLDRVRARPAWSLSWLRGDPSLVVALRAGQGRIDGTVRLGEAPGFRGDLAEVDLALLPQALPGSPGLALDGRLGGELDLRMGEVGPEGTLALRATEGSLSLPDFPIGVPYQSIAAEATLGGDALLTIGSLVVDGPMLALDASGTVGHGPAPGLSPLALQARLDVREPALRDMVAGAGVALGPDGRADLAIGGTLSAPEL
ncbi:MAG TPA: type II secretion system protein GspN, partial [Myxococcota bacterium]|nr:type II secretion system protein GspN [Myxococcota bacterium]